jgi:hypothetical protein
MRLEYIIAIGVVATVALVTGILMMQPATESPDNVVMQGCGTTEAEILDTIVFNEASKLGLSTSELRANEVKMAELGQIASDRYQAHLERCVCIREVDKLQFGEYNGSTFNGVPSCVFENLPAKPVNFNTIVQKITFNEMTLGDFCTTLGEEYWKQPDFYPNSLPFYNAYLDPDRDADGTLRRGVYGFGSYISELLANVDPGQNFSLCTYIHTGPFVSTFQSMALSVKAYGGEGDISVKFKKNKFSDGATGTSDKDMSKYFDIDITPPYILLEPAYPLFFENWAQKVRLDVQVSKNTPPGNYMLVMTPYGSMPAEIDDYYERLYGNNYIRASGFYQDVLMVGVVVR